MHPPPGDLAAAVARRTSEIVAALGALDANALRGPSLLPDWSRLTIACHLRYGAAALARMTDDALAGRPTSYYPGGRARQRPGTLAPDDGESPADVVASLATRSGELHGRWSELTPDQWATVVDEPPDNPDLGSMPLQSFALLRLTEVEVHGTDLDLGLDDWSDGFVAAALPFRIRRLAGRRPAIPVEGSWLLVADDGATHLVTATPTSVETGAASPDEPATARIEGSARDLLALLLGRPPVQPLRRAGDVDLAEAFDAAFPGP